jgi:hypothetical protein
VGGGGFNGTGPSSFPPRRNACGNPSEVAAMLTAIEDAILQIEARFDGLERRLRGIAWFVAAHILVSTVIAGVLVFGRW